MTIDKCRVCGEELDTENWNPSSRKGNSRICKGCDAERMCLWRKANPDKYRAIYTKSHRKRGVRSFRENKECAAFLGVRVAERVLRHTFNDVKMMPYGNPGFDFICNRKKWIDVNYGKRDDF